MSQPIATAPEGTPTAPSAVFVIQKRPACERTGGQRERLGGLQR